MLCDLLVCGISDANFQRRLLSVTKLDFRKAKEIAIAMEQAECAQDIKTKPTSHSMQTVNFGVLYIQHLN